jgi:hypothetical protein
MRSVKDSTDQFSRLRKRSVRCRGSRGAGGRSWEPEGGHSPPLQNGTSLVILGYGRRESHSLPTAPTDTCRGRSRGVGFPPPPSDELRRAAARSWEPEGGHSPPLQNGTALVVLGYGRRQEREPLSPNRHSLWLWGCCPHRPAPTQGPPHTCTTGPAVISLTTRSP